MLTDELMAIVRDKRYRTRNLHDGYPVPPPRRPRAGRVSRPAYVGESDRYDAIVGYDGYITAEDRELGFYLAYKSGRGVNRAIPRIEAMDGTVKQVGDFEVAGTVPADQLEAALKLIRVSRLAPGCAENLKKTPVQNTSAA